MWIDLTKTLSNDLDVFPGDPQIIVQQQKTIDDDGYTLYHLSMGLHSGTHIDAPKHMYKEGAYLDEIPVHKFIGKVDVIDASTVSNVSSDSLRVSNLASVDMVFVHGGSTETLIDESFANVLIANDISILGIDFPSPDKPPYEIHKLLLAHDILIVENLCNLDQLLNKQNIDIVIAPLKIHTDGAPVRVFAKI